MKNQDHPYSHKLNLVSWLVIPILALWVSTNYLIGINKKTQWDNGNAQVLSANTEEVKAAPLVEWQRTGLITLWFDDAWYSQYSTGFPILEAKNLKGALSVATDLVEGEAYMTWPQIKRLQYKGWEIVSHSLSHTCDLSSLKDEDLVKELRDSQNLLRQQGLTADHFVTPCGTENDVMQSKARDYYLSLRTTEEGVNPLPVSNPYDLKIHVIRSTTHLSEVKEWINEAEDNRAWLIVVFHQIGNNNEQYEITPELFSEVINEIYKSKLPVISPAQALQLVLNK